jgi:hypothetical protein
MWKQYWLFSPFALLDLWGQHRSKRRWMLDRWPHVPFHAVQLCLDGCCWPVTGWPLTCLVRPRRPTWCVAVPWTACGRGGRRAAGARPNFVVPRVRRASPARFVDPSPPLLSSPFVLPPSSLARRQSRALASPPPRAARSTSRVPRADEVGRCEAPDARVEGEGGGPPRPPPRGLPSFPFPGPRRRRADAGEICLPRPRAPSGVPRRIALCRCHLCASFFFVGSVVGAGEVGISRERWDLRGPVLSNQGQRLDFSPSSFTDCLHCGWRSSAVAVASVFDLLVLSLYSDLELGFLGEMSFLGMASSDKLRRSMWFCSPVLPACAYLNVHLHVSNTAGSIGIASLTIEIPVFYLMLESLPCRLIMLSIFLIIHMSFFQSSTFGWWRDIRGPHHIWIIFRKMLDILGWVSSDTALIIYQLIRVKCCIHSNKFVYSEGTYEPCIDLKSDPLNFISFECLSFCW